MSSRLAPRISIVLIGAFLVGSGCGGTGLATKTDAESGTGGNLASGGAAATGGATGSGGMSTSGSGGTGTSPIASGGIDSDSCSGLYPDNPNCGGAGGNPGTGAVGTGADGAASTGGIASTGGARTGSGGSVSTGGIVSTGGTRSTGGAGGGSSVIDGGSTTGCSCAGGTTTFDCFCGVHSCARTLSSFTADAGAGGGYSTLEEYGNCNLVVVTVATGLAGGVYVFDRTTGRLVGERYESDVPDACPFDPDASSYRTLSAGQFPDATCVRSECLNGIFPAISACPDAGI